MLIPLLLHGHNTEGTKCGMNNFIFAVWYFSDNLEGHLKQLINQMHIYGKTCFEKFLFRLFSFDCP